MESTTGSQSLPETCFHIHVGDVFIQLLGVESGLYLSEVELQGVISGQ